MILSILVSVLVKLLVDFFESWWVAHHPADPGPAKAAFVDHVSTGRYFYLGSRRGELAGKVFDKFLANYREEPPMFQLSTAPLTARDANALARRYTIGLVLTDAEAAE